MEKPSRNGIPIKKSSVTDAFKRILEKLVYHCSSVCGKKS